MIFTAICSFCVGHQFLQLRRRKLLGVLHGLLQLLEQICVAGFNRQALLERRNRGSVVLRRGGLLPCFVFRVHFFLLGIFDHLVLLPRFQLHFRLLQLHAKFLCCEHCAVRLESEPLLIRGHGLSKVSTLCRRIPIFDALFSRVLVPLGGLFFLLANSQALGSLGLFLLLLQLSIGFLRLCCRLAVHILSGRSAHGEIHGSGEHLGHALC